jgi:hypothetical protein
MGESSSNHLHGWNLARLNRRSDVGRQLKSSVGTSDRLALDQGAHYHTCTLQRDMSWHGNIRRQASAWAANRRASESEARQLAWADRDRAMAMHASGTATA